MAPAETFGTASHRMQTGPVGHSKPTAVFPSSQALWDYPSIGVDASGRIIIGAVAFPGPTGYYASVSTDGITFSAPALVVNPGMGNGGGARSRVIATNNFFRAFVPTLNASFLPTAVNRYQSSDGIHWTGPNLIATFSAPLNNSPSSPFIFYAPLLSAAGYTDGRWTTAFQINNAGFNNVYICTSDRGCGIANPQKDDEFLIGVSTSVDRRYWIGYLAFSTLNTRQLPLITQAIFFPAGQAPVGATTNTGIDPTKWILRNDRCAVGSCYSAGDFNTVASNPFASATTPFVKQDFRQTDLFQSFVQDPNAASNVPNFVPGFIPHPLGADLRALGVVEPLVEATALTALPPERTIGVVPSR